MSPQVCAGAPDAIAFYKKAFGAGRDDGLPGKAGKLLHAAIQIGRASTATMLSSLGMAFGPLAGGGVFDTFDAYGLLFAGSFAVGHGAAAIALAFPPLPRERLQPA